MKLVKEFVVETAMKNVEAVVIKTIVSDVWTKTSVWYSVRENVRMKIHNKMFNPIWHAIWSYKDC